MLVGEPKSHLSDEEWSRTLHMVRDAGFAVGEENQMYNLRLATATIA
jgi:hypothetical protein